MLDALQRVSNSIFKTERYGSVAEFKHKGRTLILLKPSTYMNLSGKAVNYWMQKEKIPLENVFVIVDDIAIPFGSIRIRTKGSDGGHNGLKSINEHCGTSDYARLRFGIGGDFSKGMQIDYVLGEWGDLEMETLSQRIDVAVEAIKSVVTIGVERAMNIYNKK